MSMTTYPLDNIDYDASGAELFHCTRTSGIYAAEDFSCSITGADNIITIGSGLAWIRNAKLRGKVAALPSEEALDMGLPDSTYPRIDAIVIQFDANKNATSIVQKKGTPASNPQPPEVVQTEAVYELHRYHIRREVGAVAITAADITDLALDTKYCGLMADSVTQINTDAINAQAMALIAQLRNEISAVKESSAFVLKSGGTMTGALSIPEPTAAAHAANKSYVDSKHFVVTATIPTTWSQSGNVYTLTLPIAGILATDTPHIAPVLSSDYATRQAQKEAFGILGSGRAETGDGTITFTCDDEKPSIEIPIQIEVNR